MKIALVVLGGLAVLVLAVVVVGTRLPQDHVATRERWLPAAPEEVFGVIAAPQDYPAWRRGVERVEALPPTEGKTTFREVGGDGAITYVFDEALPGERLVSRIADAGLPFGGAWTFELRPVDGGTLLRITEAGEIYNPVFRFMSRFVFGPHATLDRYLDDLEARLSAPPTAPSSSSP